MNFYILLLLFFPQISINTYSQKLILPASEFPAELRKALSENDERYIDTLIMNHRLYVKPFVDGLIRESISEELNGNTKAAVESMKYAEKTSNTFEKYFGERSLTIAVGYLKGWTIDEKRKKLNADSIYLKGTRLRIARDYDKALAELKTALHSYASINDERGEGEVLGGLGAVYFATDYDSALAYYEKALIKREKVDDRQLTAATLNGMGSVYYNYFHDYPKALHYYDKAAAIREEIGDLAALQTTLSYEAYVLMAVAEQLKISGNYEEAIKNLEAAIEIRLKINDEVRIAETLNQMGFVYSKLGDYPAALAKLAEAESLMKAANDEQGLAGIYNHYGIVLNDAGRLEKSFEYYTRALKIYEDKNDVENSLPVLNNMANILQAQKKYSDAGDLYTRGLLLARQINSGLDEGNFLLNMANNNIYLGLLDESMNNYNLAREVADSLGDPDLLWRIYVGMAENYEKRDQFERTILLNDTALKIIENIRNSIESKELKTSYIARERYIFEDIINLLLGLHEKEPSGGFDMQAFRYSEQSKSRVLLDLLNESSTDKKVPEVSTPEKAQELCPDKSTILLNYFVGDSSSCLWVITGSGHKLYRLPDQKTIQEKIETLRFALLDREQNETEYFITAGRALYEILVRPAEPYLKKTSRLIIIPDGVLNYLPFEVLLADMNGVNSQVSYQDLPYLIKKYPVSYVQSASVLKSLVSENKKASEAKVPDKKLVAFGDPVYDKPGGASEIPAENFKRLEYSAVEVGKIASFFKPQSAELFLGNDATEDNVKMDGRLKNFAYIHFATHGIIDEKKPDQSALVLSLSNNSEEDGFLRAAEIFNLNLDADLVVLSACQTGLGKLVKGEGIVGLTRAFMCAGTPSVLVSLWSVSDNSTATLMSEFYRNIVKTGLYKTEALRKAQLSVMRDSTLAHPFYWAPFVLIGDWK